MAKNIEKKRKVVVTTKKSTKLKPTVSKSQRIDKTAVLNIDFVFGKSNYVLMFIGIGLIFIGMMLMTGGQMPSPDVWDDNIIYSTTRTIIAPAVILAGLIVEFFAIFRK